MAITRKPKKPIPDADVERLIHKGGSVPTETKEITTVEKPRPLNVQLRILPELLARVDKVLESRGPLAPSRHHWLLEAVIDKLEREEPISVTVERVDDSEPSTVTFKRLPDEVTTLDAPFTSQQAGPLTATRADGPLTVPPKSSGKRRKKPVK